MADRRKKFRAITSSLINTVAGEQNARSEQPEEKAVAPAAVPEAVEVKEEPVPAPVEEIKTGASKEVSVTKEDKAEEQKKIPRKPSRKSTPAEKKEPAVHAAGKFKPYEPLPNEPMTSKTVFLLRPSAKKELDERVKKNEVKSINFVINVLLDQYLREVSSGVLKTQAAEEKKIPERDKSGKRLVPKPVSTEKFSVRVPVILKASAYDYLKYLKSENQIKSINAVVNSLLDEYL